MTAAPPTAPDAARVLARARAENFPVASRVLPAAVRSDLMAIYGFARLVDDIGDDAPGDRLALLDWVSAELDAVYRGEPPAHALLRRVGRAIHERGLPRGPFDRLVEANRQDQRVTRYATFEDLRAYCALSADPVGELVLRTCGAWTAERGAWSDDVCTGLQLLEFWQDLGEDLAMGRLYVPVEDVERFGIVPDDLRAAAHDARFAALMRFEAERTRELLASGRRLARSLGGRLGLAVRLFMAGGLAGLRDLERRGFDTFDANAHASTTVRARTAARELIRR